ncbi:MAG: hypothetical protein GXO46_08550 [Chlorobi bacterium]|nr:hypothetical protein [Chlorobiota bacterium]
MKLYRKILAQIAMKILFEKKIVMESWKKLQKKVARLCEQLYMIISFWQDGYIRKEEFFGFEYFLNYSNFKTTPPKISLKFLTPLQRRGIF